MSSSSYPIKAIYDTAGTTVTGLGEFTSGDLVAFDVLPTGTSSTEVAVGNHNHDLAYSKLDHAHDAVYSKKPGIATTVDRVALFADTIGGLKQTDVVFSALTQCSSTTTLNNLAVFSNTGGDIQDSTLGLGSVVRGPDFGTSQAANTLPVFSGSGNTLMASNVSGMAKLSSGVVSAAVAGTDYVDKATKTDFTKPQKPSFNAVILNATTNAYNWDLTLHQTLHLTIPTGVSATLSLASSGLTSDLVGLSYRLIVSGGATLTLPNTIKWALSTAPTLTNSATKADIFTFEVMTLNGALALVEIGRNLSVG